jgi:hypothetical protein
MDAQNRGISCKKTASNGYKRRLRGAARAAIQFVASGADNVIMKALIGDHVKFRVEKDRK